MSDLASAVFSVVMVGHSLFGQTGPDMLDAALSARAGTVEVQAQIINGAPLRYNWENSASAEGIDARAVLPQGTTTDLILTEAIPLANHLQWSETELYAQAFAGLALSARPDARVFVQEGWHSLKSGTGVQIAHDAGAATPWRVRLQTDLADWEGIVAALRDGSDGRAGQVALIPAGQALGALSDAIAAGTIPGLSQIGDVFDDDIHLNDIGHYLVSMVQFAVLTGADPVGLPHRVSDRYGQPFQQIDAALAQALQTVARDTVEAYRGGALTAAAATPPPAPAPATLPTPRAPPVAAEAVTHVATPDRDAQMALGLAPVRDWSTQQPFLDLMKTARIFTTWFLMKPVHSSLEVDV